jgi:hypothetical protein
MKKKMKVSSDSYKIFVVIDSAKLLLAHPVLFLPKLLLAVLYGVGTLSAAALAKGMFQLYSMPKDQMVFSSISSLLAGLVFLLVLTVVSYFLDLFFSGWYPILVEYARKGKINFFAAFNEVKPKVFSIFVLGSVVFMLIFVVSLVEAGIVFAFNANNFGLVLSLLISFVFIFFFYFLYPVVAFKKQGFSAYFKENFSSILENKKIVFVYSFIPFSVSIIKFGVAFFADSVQAMVLFWGLVLLTAVVYALHAVVNQLLYSKVGQKGKLIS